MKKIRQIARLGVQIQEARTALINAVTANDPHRIAFKIEEIANLQRRKKALLAR